jgi:ABC-type phosphate/phosphonate transport system permease subunit
MGEGAQVEDRSEFWADVTAVAVTPVAIAAGLAKGAYDASTDNGAFIEGFNSVAQPIITAGKNFGAEHGQAITNGVVGGAAGALGARIVHAGLRHLRF